MNNSKIYQDIDFQHSPDWYLPTFKAIMDKFQTIGNHVDFLNFSLPRRSGKTTFVVKSAHHMKRLFGLDVVIVVRREEVYKHINDIAYQSNISLPTRVYSQSYNFTGYDFKNTIFLFDDCDFFPSKMMDYMSNHCLFVKLYTP